MGAFLFYVILFFPNIFDQPPAIFNHEKQNEKINCILQDDEQESDQINGNILKHAVDIADKRFNRFFPGIFYALPVHEFVFKNIHPKIRVFQTVQLFR